MELTPRRIVEELDRYIVGQADAKRAVAVALRNRIRRLRLPPELREEISPKNILMIGPTGVGKTEIARRLARLVRAPFVKVEATKFTEVGYVGRDVESMVRDLLETAIRMVREEKTTGVQAQAEAAAEARLLDLLIPSPRRRRQGPRNPLEALLGSAFGGGGQREEAPPPDEDEDPEGKDRRRLIKEKLRRRELEEEMVEVEVEDRAPQMLEILSGAGIEEMGVNLQDLFGGLLPRRKKKRRVTVAAARKLLAHEEAQKLIDQDEVVATAVSRAEQSGIIFIDEIDKIAGREKGTGPDVSREGVQRDLLPIVEGGTVMTKHGPIRTDHVLFISAGAFHMAKPADLIPELQGRFPIRVELSGLTRDDFERILTEPDNAIIKQYAALLATEGVEIVFTPDGISELARISYEVNSRTEDIGARRLYTILERTMEEISFRADEMAGQAVNIDGPFVRERLEKVLEDRDLSRYIL
ncbi:MAG: ATP-dependent protease ATPase subunit HslU [Firmicutes bacterium]|nr:ATP-dependent protease ATPase subunit HslU [Bacillota bacterium]